MKTEVGDQWSGIGDGWMIRKDGSRKEGMVSLDDQDDEEGRMVRGRRSVFRERNTGWLIVRLNNLRKSSRGEQACITCPIVPRRGRRVCGWEGRGAEEGNWKPA